MGKGDLAYFRLFRRPFLFYLYFWRLSSELLIAGGCTVPVNERHTKDGLNGAFANHSNGRALWSWVRGDQISFGIYVQRMSADTSGSG